MSQYFPINATGSFSIAITSNAVKGYRITFEIRNNTQGPITVTWPTNAKLLYNPPAKQTRNSINLTFDGTNWVPAGAQSSDFGF